MQGMDTTQGTSPSRPGQLGTVLSVWAHPDDETYLAGAVMASARDRGQRVVCVAATAGEHGTPDPVTWPPARLGRIRRWEASAAMAVLGVAEHAVLGLPDGVLVDHEVTGLAWAGSLLDDVRPDTVLTFGPDGITYHPDHIAVHRWVTRAWQDRGRPCRLLYATISRERLDRFRDDFEEWGMFMTSERPTGVPVSDLAVHLSLEGDQLDRKLTALRAMATQTGDLVTGLGLDGYAVQVAEEAFVDAVAPPEGTPPPVASRTA
jgi:LmbE family N-acetylglucosaminyl deacetylase